MFKVQVRRWPVLFLSRMGTRRESTRMQHATLFAKLLPGGTAAHTDACIHAGGSPMCAQDRVRAGMRTCRQSSACLFGPEVLMHPAPLLTGSAVPSSSPPWTSLQLKQTISACFRL